MTRPTTKNIALPVPLNIYESMVELRRDLHQHPELSWKESRTCRRVTEQLHRLGIPFKIVAEHGVIATIPGRNRDAPAVALRADMDALPVHEETGLEFESQTEGVMHACGHDGHTSMLVGAAQMLLNDLPPVDVRLIWQPAEEHADGAPAMIEAGCLEGVGAIFGGHVDRHYAVGELVVTTGAVNASTDLFEIDIHGRGGHGARPHEALDAVVVGSLLVTSLQTIVSREVDPAHPSVISVGMFQAGQAPNVIAGRAHLEGTIRSQSPEVRDHLGRSITRIAEAVGALHEAEVDIVVDRRTPALINTPQMAEIAREAARNVVGEAHVTTLRTANMGGEDFACYLDHVPGCYIRYGAQVPGRENFPAHSSRFDFHENALATGAAWLDSVARIAGERLSAGETFGTSWELL